MFGLGIIQVATSVYDFVQLISCGFGEREVEEESLYVELLGGLCYNTSKATHDMNFVHEFKRQKVIFVKSTLRECCLFPRESIRD